MYSEFAFLFFSGLVSATLFPGGSELLLIYYLHNSPDNALGYFTAITVGNSLGAFITYFMGYYLSWGREKTQQKHEKISVFCRRYGAPALLLSWLPIVGDLLPLIAGWLKVAIVRSLLCIFVGKALRYGAIIISTQYLL